MKIGGHHSSKILHCVSGYHRVMAKNEVKMAILSTFTIEHDEVWLEVE